ncbi:restriction endonuclease subunit S [Nibribacter koreensis]|uniref:Type I restriction modification DNA specificity domain-containing protein n=1 Tax=Nibribacter koreensis TaxID=1084519 RepID=A0ABP8F5R5_9BACT
MMEAEVVELITEVKKVPMLRFPDFKAEWKKNQLGSFTKIYDGTHQTPIYTETGIPFYSVEQITANDFENCKKISEEVYERECKRVKLEKGDILMTRVGDVGTSKYFDWDVKASFYVNVAVIKKSEAANNRFIDQYIKSSFFQKELYKRTIHVAFPKKINLGEIGKCSVNLPSLLEQDKIASFLTSVDDKTQQLAKKKDLLEKYMKGVMQQIFSQQIRFKDENRQDFPEWEEKKLGQVFERVKTKNAKNNKNVLTISAQQGLVNQEDYFNKSVSAENVTGYYLLHKGDFAYNKSYSKGYPMGAIKRLTKYDKGVVSTLYICFKIKDGSSEAYYEQYFNSGYLNSELQKIAQEGARNHGLLNMSVVEFFNDIELPRPSESEQLKIAAFLSAIDNKIELVTTKLEQAKLFKKALLQQMFV